MPNTTQTPNRTIRPLPLTIEALCLRKMVITDQLTGELVIAFNGMNTHVGRFREKELPALLAAHSTMDVVVSYYDIRLNDSYQPYMMLLGSELFDAQR